MQGWPPSFSDSVVFEFMLNALALKLATTLSSGPPWVPFAKAPTSCPCFCPRKNHHDFENERKATWAVHRCLRRALPSMQIRRGRPPMHLYVQSESNMLVASRHGRLPSQSSPGHTQNSMCMQRSTTTADLSPPQ